jgi:hypothetical protein
MTEFEIILVSPVDEEGQVAELWDGDELLADLRIRDISSFTLRLFAPSELRYWTLRYESFVEALGQMRRLLAPSQNAGEGSVTGP